MKIVRYNNNLNLPCFGAVENNSIIKADEIKKKLNFLYKENLFFLNIKDIEEHFIINDKSYELAYKFWPGPLTLILEKKINSKYLMFHHQ